MAYKVLLSDVGNVMAPFFPKRFTLALSRMADMSVERAETLFYREMEGELTAAANGCKGLHRGILTGELSSEEFHLAVQERFGCALPADGFWPAFCDIFDPNTRIVELWDNLRRSGRIERIVLVSDADPRRLRRALDLTGLRPDAMAVSYEVGQLKPHEAMYRRALSLARARPQECVFVDDLAENVSAAREFGIESFQYLYKELGVDAATDVLIEEFKHIGLLD
ncbi:MAG: HAD-IA family hydrolase [Patescibacteria group bacterium]|nr:HAD-IA family hydrolase [Patescibacteria group bacterium]